MQPQAQDIKNQLNGKASSIANSAVSAAAPIAEQVTGQLSESYEMARDYAVDAYDTTIAYAKKHPGRMLVTGLAVGALAGFLLARRK